MLSVTLCFFSYSRQEFAKICEVGSDIKENASMWVTQIWSLGWDDPLEREWLPTQVTLVGELEEQKSLVRSWGRKESDMTERLTLPLVSPIEYY